MNELIGKAQEYISTGTPASFDAFMSLASTQQGMPLPSLSPADICTDEELSTDIQEELEEKSSGEAASMREAALQSHIAKTAELFADDLDEIRRDPKFTGEERQLEALRDILMVGHKDAVQGKR